MSYVIDSNNLGTLIAKEGGSVNIYVSQKESPAVHNAVNDLIRDLQKVCGCYAKVCDEPGLCNIIIGTVGISEAIENSMKEARLDISELKNADDSLIWEAYQIKMSEDCLYITGTDRRGTVFGIYDFCSAMGVSPWYFFADVPVKKKKYISVSDDFYKVDYPSVMYRGIFINDEEELDSWAKAHTKDGTIGPETYRHIFELLLRLKANYIWPAMHVNYFNENPENGRLAEEMGIVVGTTHCDMLLRSNQNEWKPWLDKKKYQDVQYDYSIPGRNREILHEYWRESVEQNKEYEVCYTVGMRGIHDYGFRTERIDQDTTLSGEEKQKAKIQLLGQIIKAQRNILQEVLHTDQALQTFIPYKEVLPLYDDGLELPEDITLMWVDDNFGHMRRYPNKNELKRSGGHGLYYHNSYWAAPAMSYLFINSIPLAQTGNELKKSYESGIQKIWVLNVGALKPLELDMDFFLTYAWEAGKSKNITENPSEFTAYFIDQNFSGNHGEEAAKLYDSFNQITNVCKLEHMSSDRFSQTAYGDEAGRRLNQIEYIFHKANNIYKKLPENEREAFFQLYLMKIHASYYVNHEFYYADRSVLSYRQGKMQCADLYLELSRKMADYKKSMLLYYNKKMAEGKWDLILTPESFSPPCTAIFPAAKPALSIKDPEMDIVVWNQEEPGKELLITFSRYGIQKKWFEIFNKGAESIYFKIDCINCSDWITLSETEGNVISEKRIQISIKDWQLASGQKGSLKLRDIRSGQYKVLELEAISSDDLPKEFNGYVEADGYISIAADRFDEERPSGMDRWVVIPNLGRYQGNAVQALCDNSMDINLLNNPYLEYDLFFETEGEFLLEIYRNITLNSVGKIRFGIGIDNSAPAVIESDITDEWHGNWKKAVIFNGDKMYRKLPYITKGIHKLRLYLLDNYVTISKMVIYTKKFRESSLGPQISYFKKDFFDSEIGIEQPIVDFAKLDQISADLYKTKPEEVPLPNLIYADKDFWNYNRLYLRNEEYPQYSLGEKKYYADPDGRKDVIKKFGRGIFAEDQGIIALEAEYVLEQSENAYRTNGIGQNLSWTHTQAETDDETGLAMYVAEHGVIFDNPKEAPGMHYRIQVNQGGKYCVWLFIKFEDDNSDSCYIALDNEVQPLSSQFSRGRLFTYSTQQIWFWTMLTEIEIAEGIHTFSIYARKSRLRIDRIYLSRGEERPPADLYWTEALRRPLSD